MQEKKKFILAVPTVIIIIVFIIGMSLIFYNRNYKPLSKDEALKLAESALAVKNISCQVVVNQNNEETISNYKRKDSTVYISSNDYKEIINIDSKESTYIDEENKEIYKYYSDSVLESYNNTIYAALQVLNDKSFNYEFIKYEKCNGIKCANIKLSDDSTVINMWIDRENGLVTKYDITYKTDEETATTSYVYRYQLNSVKDEDVKVPVLDNYTVMDYSN